jgi:hypothetical protein
VGLRANDDISERDGRVNYCPSATEAEARLPDGRPLPSADDRTLVESLLTTLPSDVTTQQCNRLRNLLLDHVNVFARHEYDSGLTTLMECKLELINSEVKPIVQPLRRHALCHLDIIDAEVNKLLAADIIQPTNNSSFSSNVVLVKKRQIGNEPVRYRLAVDLSDVNTVLKPKQAVLPHIDSIIDSLQGAHYFTQLDFAHAFFSVPVAPESQYLTTFATRRGLFSFKRMPNGLQVAPGVFCQLIQFLFGHMLWHEVLAFMDDLIIPSKSIDSGIETLTRVFEKIAYSGLKLKPSKCKFFQTKAHILGLVVENGCIQEDESRKVVIQNFEFPRTVRQLRRFIGFVGYGRQFYSNLAEIIAPLTACLRKGAKISQTPETLRAFEQVKALMCNPSILTIFNPQYECILECDASLTACGCCLKQRSPDGKIHIVSYHSQIFTPAQTRYCTTRREALSVMVGLAKYRHFLLNRAVTVTTDHASLCHIMRSKNLSAQLQRYREYMSDFDIKFEYVPGKLQVISDFLSRIRPCDSANVRCKQCREGRGPDWEANDIEDELVEPALTCIGRDGAACRIMTRADYRKQEITLNNTLGQNPIGANRQQTDRSTVGTHVLARQQDSIVSNTTDATSRPDAADDMPPSPPCRPRRNRRNILQVAVPTAYKDMVKNNWSTEYIIKQQKSDPTLDIVREWLINGERQCDMPATSELNDYWLQFDTLRLDNDILYRQYFDNTGTVINLQTLIPPTMRTSILELIHGAVGHAQMSAKNEHMLARHAC